jgi:H+/Cl- antiporter ClcA
MVAIGTLVGVLFNRVVALLLGQAEANAYFVVRIALLSALYNAILTPIFFPLLRRLTQVSTKQRVRRW